MNNDLNRLIVDAITNSRNKVVSENITSQKNTEHVLSDGDNISWSQGGDTKPLVGIVKMANGMKKNGVKHAVISINGAEFSVPHTQLNKIV